MSEQDTSPSPPSLNFVSTQIQSRYEADEQREFNLARLRQFQNMAGVQALRGTAVKRKKVRKNSARTKNPGPAKNPALLRAYVRQSFAARQPIDSRSVLDYFRGEKSRADEFISLLQTASASPLSRAPGNELALFSGLEWLTILDTLQLKFPNLSAPKKKSLGLIKRKLDSIKEGETADPLPSQKECLQSLWSQASDQPKADLTTEDLKWLYDLDEEQLLHNTSIEMADEPVEAPFCFTLSQVLRSSSQNAMPLSSPVLDAETINDSESGIEPLYEAEIAELAGVSPQDELLYPDNIREAGDRLALIGDDLDIALGDAANSPEWPSLFKEGEREIPSLHRVPSRQHNAFDSVDIFTSIAFPPSNEKSVLPRHAEPLTRSTSMIQVESPSVKNVDLSPIKRSDLSPAKRKVLPTPQDWPSEVVFGSCRLPAAEDATQLGSIRSTQHTPTSLPAPQFQPASSSAWTYERIIFLGPVDLRPVTDPALRLEVETGQPEVEEQVADSDSGNEQVTVIKVGLPRRTDCPRV
ncbi:hypothetical protein METBISCDRAFT_26196 [Metschnikowia bicuspidata]|uniref:Structure-specific endonuclease subunit SLX4 n=1 Tax=Metschnikowia bicuspidata TaxID=27322 RepID=A0A4P9ZG45_9ASCO|nr:hypothetical protein METBISCDRAFT_26196 [Metschnikowia bicuspidata]